MAETFRLSEEVTRMLADTIVENEVVKPMEKIGWSESVTPPPAERGSDNPNPTEGAPTPSAAVIAGDNPLAAQSGQGEQKTEPIESVLKDLEQFKDPATGKYFGKYPTQAEALKGVGHVVQMAKNAFTQAQQAREELAALRASQAAPSSPAAAPAAGQPAITDTPRFAAEAAPKSDKLEKVLADLVENGGVLDTDNMKALVDGISDLTSKVAEHTASRTLETREHTRTEEQRMWDAVDSRLQSEMPEALQFADEIGLHVQSNPLLSAGVASMIARGDRFGAAVEAAKSYFAASGIKTAEEARKAAEFKEEELKAKGAVRQEATDRARKDAGVFGTSASGVHETQGAAGYTPEEIARAGAEMQATGLGERWRSMTLARTLNDPVFDRP